MNPNSKESYDIIQPELSAREQKVLEALRVLGKATMHQVSDFTGLKVHAISGRFTKLKKKGKIIGVGNEYYTHEYEDGKTRRVPRTIYQEVSIAA